MKNRLLIMGIAIMLSGSVTATETGHYVNGVEGIKASSIPPPGLYWRMYHAYYTADRLTDSHKHSLDVGFNVNVYAFVNRLVWISETKMLGGNMGADLVVPLINTDLEISALGISNDEFGLGDIAVEPLLISWHGARYDAGFGLAAYVPTGEYDSTQPASAGKGFWTGMLTLGGTYYLDADRSWSAAVLGRYEIHSNKDGSDVRPGDECHFEWGIGKTLAKTIDVGLTGYCHWQVTDDRGSDVTWDASVHDKVLAIGPEINIFIPSSKFCVSLRSQREFDARDRSEGNISCLTLTKIF